MNTTTYSVDGTSLYYILHSAQELLGAKIYQKALETSGLSRFKEHLPEPIPTSVATTNELAAFWLSVNNQVAFPVFKLFQRNVGEKIIAMGQSSAPNNEAKKRIMALPESERLKAGMDYIAEAASQTGNPASFESYQNGYLFYFSDCPFVCHQLKSNEPLCYMFEFMFLKLLKLVTGLPLVSSEETCVAKGDNQCRYYFRTI